MLLYAFGSLGTSFIATAVAARLHLKLFDKVQSFLMEEINHFSTVSLVTRSTNEVNQVQMFIVMGLQMLVKAPIMAVGVLVKIMDKSWQWTLSTGVAVLTLLLVVGICIAIALRSFKKIQRLTDNLNRIVWENISGLRVIRAYNADDYQEKSQSRAD